MSMRSIAATVETVNPQPTDFSDSKKAPSRGAYTFVSILNCYLTRVGPRCGWTKFSDEDKRSIINRHLIEDGKRPISRATYYRWKRDAKEAGLLNFDSGAKHPSVRKRAKGGRWMTVLEVPKVSQGRFPRKDHETFGSENETFGSPLNETFGSPPPNETFGSSYSRDKTPLRDQSQRDPRERGDFGNGVAELGAESQPSTAHSPENPKSREEEQESLPPTREDPAASWHPEQLALELCARFNLGVLISQEPSYTGKRVYRTATPNSRIVAAIRKAQAEGASPDDLDSAVVGLFMEPDQWALEHGYGIERVLNRWADFREIGAEYKAEKRAKKQRELERERRREELIARESAQYARVKEQEQAEDIEEFWPHECDFSSHYIRTCNCTKQWGPEGTLHALDEDGVCTVMVRQYVCSHCGKESPAKPERIEAAS